MRDKVNAPLVTLIPLPGAAVVDSLLAPLRARWLGVAVRSSGCASARAMKSHSSGGVQATRSASKYAG